MREGEGEIDWEKERGKGPQISEWVWRRRDGWVGLTTARSASGSDSGEIGGWVWKRWRRQEWFVDQRSWVGMIASLGFGYSEGKREEERRESFLDQRCRYVAKMMTVRWDWGMNLRHNQTGKGWVVFFTFPSSSLSIFGCVSLRGGDEDDNLTGEDVLGNHFRWSVLELSLTLSLFGLFSENSLKVK